MKKLLVESQKPRPVSAKSADTRTGHPRTSLIFLLAGSRQRRGLRTGHCAVAYLQCACPCTGLSWGEDYADRATGLRPQAARTGCRGDAVVAGCSARNSGKRHVLFVGQGEDFGGAA